jgi:signal transduction histidine kinase
VADDAGELRNPLSIAQIYLESIESGGTEETGNGETSRGDEAFEEVAAALDRIDDTIDVLLVLARGGDSIIDPEPVSLRESATEAWSNLDTDAARLDAETDLTLAAEPHHVRNLLENLFRNAIEHGGRDVTVRVGSLGGDSTGALAGFYVEDDGPGIPADERDAVFEAGYTTDADGLGLGLTFISQLADAYGWECRLTESEEGGARFEFAGVEVVS